MTCSNDLWQSILCLVSNTNTTWHSSSGKLPALSVNVTLRATVGSVDFPLDGFFFQNMVAFENFFGLRHFNVFFALGDSFPEVSQNTGERSA